MIKDLAREELKNGVHQLIGCPLAHRRASTFAKESQKAVRKGIALSYRLLGENR
jgi:hypothetical protein